MDSNQHEHLLLSRSQPAKLIAVESFNISWPVSQALNIRISLLLDTNNPLYDICWGRRGKDQVKYPRNCWMVSQCVPHSSSRMTTRTICQWHWLGMFVLNSFIFSSTEPLSSRPYLCWRHTTVALRWVCGGPEVDSMGLVIRWMLSKLGYLTQDSTVPVKADLWSEAVTTAQRINRKWLSAVATTLHDHQLITPQSCYCSSSSGWRSSEVHCCGAPHYNSWGGWRQLMAMYYLL